MKRIFLSTDAKQRIEVSRLRQEINHSLKIRMLREQRDRSNQGSSQNSRCDRPPPSTAQGQLKL
ncbi:hypothetical protein [Synechococcus elongatus]|uniref:hypothetical protein n=1 Tax=Synechococcus elongatus TaxID=32046 RepID=UPI0030CB37AB